MTNKLTKNDMARVIVQALYNSEKLPRADNCNVLAMTKSHKLDWFREFHPKAIKILMENQRRKREEEDRKS